jgi:hypothetical protein
MPNTTKMAIPYPSSTDLVKDGATNMQSLATQVDAKSGLVLISTTAFTSVTTQSFNNVFSSNFDNYKILISSSISSDTDMAIRLRASGADNSTTNSYILQRNRGNNTSIAGTRQTNNYFQGFNMYNDDNNALEITLFRPFLAKATLINATMMYSLNTGILDNFAGQHNQATSYDGFTFYGATFTGTISIYGFNKG